MSEPETEPHVLRREIISQDKDGTLEKIYEKPYDRVTLDENGAEKVERVEPWEVRATGKKVQELKGAFKDTAPQMLHEQSELNRKIGMEKITLADGSVDETRADRVDLLRTRPGVCQTRIRPGIMMKHMPWHKPCGHSRHQECHCEGDRVDG